jgi:quinol monooxygenase YgiN
MSANIYWVLETNVREGKLDELKSLMKEMVDATKANEPGTLNYEWTISEDSKRCTIYERYADSAAALKHASTFMKTFAGRFVGCVEPKKMVVHGTPADDLRKALTSQGAVFMTPFGGFSR